MVKYNGVLDYYVLSLDGKRVILLLDNHALENYCKYPAENVDRLLHDYLVNYDSTLLLEEIYGNVTYNRLFNTKHLNIYDKFYNENKKNVNIIPVDIRILINSGNNLKYFFDDEDNSESNEIKEIKEKILSEIKKDTIFKNQYECLKADYQRLLLCKIESDYQSLNLNISYPFKICYDEKIDIQWFNLFSGILELYTICNILQSSKQNVFNYLGAAHCITIFNILDKYYGYIIKKDTIFNTNNRDSIEYSELQSLNRMCTDVVLNPI